MNTYLGMRPHHTKGLLISFCGLDGCGKSTMIRRLSRDLEWEGLTVVLTKQPTDKMRNRNIFRTYMDEVNHSAYSYRSLSLMAASDRVQHCNHMILPMLEEGKVVISDRYYYSCLANLRARGFEKDQWIYEIAREEIPKPDLSFFLDVPVDTAIARVRGRPDERDRYIDVDLQYRLRDEYRKICAENYGILISTDQEIKQTYAEILDYVKTYLEEQGNGKRK